MMTASSTACIGSTASIMASASSSVSAAMIASTVRLRSFGQKRPVAQQSHGAVCTCRKAFWPSRLAWMTWARDVRKMPTLRKCRFPLPIVSSACLSPRSIDELGLPSGYLCTPLIGAGCE